MSKLKELIDRLCLDGVEFKPLGELGTFFGGLTGKSKDDFKDGNAKFITYVNIYSNPALNIDVADFVKVDEKEKQNRIQKGDILFTGSSETPNECGFTSVVTSEISEPIYLNSFCFGLRLNNPAIFNLDFLKHILRSEELRKQIGKTASGVTRFNVSKARLSKVVLPIPPIEVQDEIAKILDRFADYAAELQAELQARKEQYEYYRNLLLTFNPSACGCGTDGEQEIKVTTWGGYSYEIAWKAMGEVLEMKAGKSIPSSSIVNINTGGMYACFGANGLRGYVNKANNQTDNVLIGRQGALCGNVCFANGPYYATDHAVVVGDSPLFNKRFLFHLLVNANLNQYKTAGAQPGLSVEILKKVIIPVPPIELQEKIVAILDRFETLVNDLTQGLPAEIAAVKEQYEYYRNKLLTFKQLA